MIVYKGFNENLQATCGKGIFQYEQGKTYTEEKSKTRSTGFHAAEYILDCLNWYALDGKNRFFRCEAGGSIDEEEGCSMVVSTELTLEKELNLTEIAFAAMRYIIEHPKRDWRVITRGAPGIPFYTIEVEPGGTIRQHRSYYDEEPGIEEIRAFLKEWQKVIRKRLTEEDRKLAKISKVKREANIAELKEKNNTRVLQGLAEDFLEAEELEAV